MVAALENNNFSLRRHPAHLRCRAHSRCIAADDDQTLLGHSSPLYWDFRWVTPACVSGLPYPPSFSASFESNLRGDQCTHELSDARTLRHAHMETRLRAPPQHVLADSGPFALRHITHFALE